MFITINPITKRLFAGTVPANNTFFAGTVMEGCANTSQMSVGAGILSWVLLCRTI